MSELENVDLTNFDFDAALNALVNPERPDLTGDPTPEEWEKINLYRWHVESFYKQLEPEAIAIHDEMVAYYERQIVDDWHLDIFNLRSLYNITLTLAINQFFVRQSAQTCGAGPIMSAHVMEHYVEGSLRFDYLLRQAFIRAGAPAPHAPAEKGDG